jgi:uncharacterized membrane protein YkoI
MRSTITALGIVTLLGLCLVSAMADEEKVPLDKVPKVVLEAIKTRFSGADLVGATKELENGKTVYEISFKHKGSNYDVIVTPEGTITLIEKEIAAKDLPKVVAKAVEDKYPKATWKKTEEVIKVENKVEKLAYYEVLLVTTDKKMLEIEIDPSGKIIKQEKKDEKDK